MYDCYTLGTTIPGMKVLAKSTTLYKYRHSRFVVGTYQVSLPVNKNQLVAYKYHLVISSQIMFGSETIRRINVANVMFLSMVIYL